MKELGQAVWRLLVSVNDRLESLLPNPERKTDEEMVRAAATREKLRRAAVAIKAMTASCRTIRQTYMVERVIGNMALLYGAECAGVQRRLLRCLREKQKSLLADCNYGWWPYTDQRVF
jgi:hypothetical protein